MRSLRPTTPRRVSLIATFGLVALACNKPADTPLAASPAAPREAAALVNTIDVDDPSSCAPCHADVVDEWQQSQHAYAHASNDPLYASMLRLRSDRAGRDLEQNCASCHHPRSLDPTTPTAAQGVSCATCHTVAEVAEGNGHDALRFAEEDRLFGPHAVNGAGAPHLTGAPAEHLTDGQTLCLACHGEVRNPNNVSTCNTGPEFAAHGGDETCVGCHMPQVNAPSGVVSTRPTHRSHAFLAAHGARRSGDESVMRSTARMTGTIDADGLALQVENLSAHAAPTGFPGRRLTLGLVGKTADGASVWTAADAGPELADALAFTRYYGDEEGNPSMPPFATQLLRDTRLVPGESRQLRVPLPDEVMVVEARLMFHFAAPPALANLGLEDDPHFAPMVIAEATFRRSTEPTP